MRKEILEFSPGVVNSEFEDTTIEAAETETSFVERCGMATVAVYDQLGSIYAGKKVEHDPSPKQHKIIGCGSIAVAVSGTVATANFYL